MPLVGTDGQRLRLKRAGRKNREKGHTAAVGSGEVIFVLNLLEERGVEG